jgi:3-deoxy-manno-octulosonate cytidylyltransferase (CMP-KDO synthetase)
MTSGSCLSGTDRVYEASKLVPKNDINYIINVQGDMPFVEPEVILTVIESLKSSSYEIITPVVKVGIDIANSHSNVKVVTDVSGKALYFSRSLIPHGATEFLYHIGIYGFRKSALAKFVKIPQTHLEKNEKLEQLRALQHGIDIGVCYSDTVPISVDTSDDLDKAIEFYNNRNFYAKMVVH